jgi:hypothetical protein
MTEAELLTTLHDLADGPCDQFTLLFALGAVMGFLKETGHDKLVTAILAIERNARQSA